MAAKKKDRKAGKDGFAMAETAHEIWLAGLGALVKAQEDGSKLFTGLVKEGTRIAEKGRKAAERSVKDIQGGIESRVGAVKGHATDAWETLESRFLEQVALALGKLGVPTAEEVTALTAQVEALKKSVDKLAGPAKPRSRTEKKKPAAKKKATAKKKPAARRKSTSAKKSAG